MTADHNHDRDCTVGDDDFCAGCGVLHGDPCGHCGGRGYHATDDCPALYEESGAVLEPTKPEVR